MGHVGGYDFDCAYDERVAKQLKRTQFDFWDFDTNTSSDTLWRTLEDVLLGDRMDKDYRTFLYHLTGNSEFRRTLKEEIDDVDNDADPQYKMFLEKLKEDGKSYVLEVDINNNMSLRIKYEAEVGLDEEHESPTLGKLRKVPDTVMTETAKDLRKVPDTVMTETAKDFRNLSSKDNRETQDNLMYVMGKDMLDASKNMTKAIEIERRNLVVAKDLNFEHVNHVSSETNGFSCQKSSPKGNHLSKVECKHGMEVDVVVDEDYQKFLDFSKKEGDLMVLEIKDGEQVIYEGNKVESSSDSEVFMTYNASDLNKGNYNPFETSRGIDSIMEEDEQQCLEYPDTGNRSEFRDKLMGKLREPYDHEEYERLWQTINEQKPMDGRHRDLRGSAALKSYSKDECNPSYLERHSNLKKKIRAAKFDRRKVLNLLRGFFFWLENLVHEDAFLPWLDPSCLEVLPSNR